MSRNCKRHMCAACRLVGGVNDLPIFNDADTRGAASDVHHSAVLNIQNRSRSGRFVHNVGNLKARALQHMSDTLYASLGYSRRNGCRRIDKLCSQPVLQFHLQLLHQLHGFIIIYNDSVPDGMRRRGNSRYRTVLAVHHRKHRIRCSQVHAGL